MEIRFDGANRRSGFYPLIKETPINTHFDSKDGLTLELAGVHIYQRSGEYDVSITLTPEDIGKIVAEFYKQALTKNN